MTLDTLYTLLVILGTIGNVLMFTGCILGSFRNTTRPAGILSVSGALMSIGSLITIFLIAMGGDR